MQIDWNTQSVGEVVRNNMHAAGVFERYGIDYCCGGRQSLSEACERSDADSEALQHELADLPEHGAPNVAQWDTSFLIDYIINTHHNYVRSMLPTIHAHAAKVAQVHGDNHPETREIASIFMEVKQELEQHLMKEERILFPYIKQMLAAARGEAPVHAGGFGSVAQPIAMMEQEHDNAGLAFDRMRSLSGDFTPPEDACTTYQLLYRELDEFERDLHMHIHLENNVLHPRAKEVERTLATAA
ncbi:iron-sulfur cluster repair di-iron protein [bacterium]|nr:iron-sulfur cluster repair di-iron protein [bacterium]